MKTKDKKKFVKAFFTMAAIMTAVSAVLVVRIYFNQRALKLFLDPPKGEYVEKEARIRAREDTMHFKRRKRSFLGIKYKESRSYIKHRMYLSYTAGGKSVITPVYIRSEKFFKNHPEGEPVTIRYWKNRIRSPVIMEDLLQEYYYKDQIKTLRFGVYFLMSAAVFFVICGLIAQNVIKPSDA